MIQKTTQSVPVYSVSTGHQEPETANQGLFFRIRQTATRCLWGSTSVNQEPHKRQMHIKNSSGHTGANSQRRRKRRVQIRITQTTLRDVDRLRIQVGLA